MKKTLITSTNGPVEVTYNDDSIIRELADKVKAIYHMLLTDPNTVEPVKKDSCQ